ncbi:DNA-protein crosslink repair co-factor UBX5 [Aspergillus clavatus NRRL 1]|uniref:UBX domain protein (Ubx5), putative n=1 Tax=Aspergillus clavatus (strain ATCC 1007 / CBS 513.65 / DSM 816 / NCTC 3887 / NRRL 1 / QM 1276 / 107) TaxID=344612 RepID=A1CDB9_ASPCL|nr:UBX domain protein (Ubx5), putative [Aspergillus clavatus NRRL 1]EAW11846.1 UBX domain protein (Ubx5), putative [Aspergillus clavatus NRRL 1]
MEGDVVAQFTEITGSTPSLATQYLQLADFNIEQAMQLYFENGGASLTEEPASSTAASRPSRATGYEDASGVVHIDSDDDVAVDETLSAPRSQPAPQASMYEDDEAMARRLQEEMYHGGRDSSDDVRAPMARTTETLVGPEVDFDDGEMHTSILGQLRARQQHRGRPGIFNQTDTADIWAGDENSQRETLAAATGGASEASSKQNMLAAMYRPPFDIMSRLPWDLARQEGRDNEKWLLVNIQDQSIFDCQVLNRDLWKDPGVKDTIKEHFIFLQYSKDDQRATPYLQYYFQASDVSDNYPHIAIVDPRTGEQMKVWSGPPIMKPAEFLMQLHEFLDRYSLKHNVRNPVAKRKFEKKEKTIDAMTEEEMLEMAMRNSLGDGTAQAPRVEDPDELTRSTEDVKGKGKVAVAEDVEMEENDLAEETPESLSVFASIPDDRPHTEPPADPATTTRIQFRHPSGRVIRRFALTDPVRRIYEWLKADPPLLDKVGVEFELNSMGRNLIDSLDVSIDEAGLKNGTVMIGYLED